MLILALIFPLYNSYSNQILDFLSNSNKTVLRFPVLILSIAAYFLLVKKPKFNDMLSANEETLVQPKLPIEKPATNRHKLKNYIQHGLSQGKSKSQIRQALLAVGWPTDEIDKVLREI